MSYIFDMALIYFSSILVSIAFLPWPPTSLSLSHTHTHTHTHTYPPSQSRFLTPWSAGSSPHRHALLHLSLCEVLSATPPFPPQPTLASTHSALNSQFHSHFLYETPLILICKSWLPPKQMHVFAKPLLVPLCLHTCSLGHVWPALVSLLSPVFHVIQCIGCAQWLNAFSIPESPT